MARKLHVRRFRLQRSMYLGAVRGVRTQLSLRVLNGHMSILVHIFGAIERNGRGPGAIKAQYVPLAKEPRTLFDASGADPLTTWNKSLHPHIL